ncbi:MAG: hypothetical protein EKK55_18340 [Rhodocyclaceae bacterium]|nr:MAG: hypothetical protein EKK55_18340 [Rhodocyclaceae bacterium]
MPTSTTFNGGRSYVPGVRLQIDPTAVSQGRAVQRRLVVVGEGQGGTPVSVTVDGEPSLMEFRTARDAATVLRGGDLLDAVRAAFEASADADVGSAGSVIVAKVNPATRSQAYLAASGVDQVFVQSRDYGAHTSRVAVSVSTTTTGRRVSASFDGAVESIDIPTRAALTVSGAGDYGAVSGEVDADGLAVTFTKTIAKTSPANAHTSGEVVSVVSAETYDVGQKVTVYGTTAAGAPIAETLVLNGTTAVDGTVQFGDITGVRVDGATLGAITISDESDDDTLYTIAASLTAAHVAGPPVVVSSSSADYGYITVYGVDAASKPIQERLRLSGLAPISGAVSFTKITAAVLDVAAAGNVTVRASGGAVAFVISAGQIDKGLRLGSGVWVPRVAPIAGVLTARHAAPPGGASFIVIRGLDADGFAAVEKLTLTENAASTTTAWSRIDQVETGEAVADILASGTARTYATTVTVAEAGASLAAAGFTVVGDSGSKPLTIGQLDYLVADPTPFSLSRQLYDLTQWASTLVEITRVDDVGTFPGDGGPFYLVGGSEGATNATHWEGALDALRTLRGVAVAVLSTDPAVHALWRSHALYMAGDGEDERSGFIALPSSTTLSQVEALVTAINDRNTAAVCQDVRRNSPEGVPTWYGPKVLAAMAASMFVAARPGQPLTRRRLNALAVRGGWSLITGKSEIIRVGAMAVEVVDGAGLRWLRSVTTWVQDDNAIYSEVSSNDAANETARRLRAGLDPLIGVASTTTATVLRPETEAILETAVREGVLAAWRDVVVEQTGDTFSVGAAIAPVEPTNFINIRLGLVRVRG